MPLHKHKRHGGSGDTLLTKATCDTSPTCDYFDAVRLGWWSCWHLDRKLCIEQMTWWRVYGACLFGEAAYAMAQEHATRTPCLCPAGSVSSGCSKHSREITIAGSTCGIQHVRSLQDRRHIRQFSMPLGRKLTTCCHAPALVQLEGQSLKTRPSSDAAPVLKVEA